MENAEDISIIEHIYQLRVSNIIKNNKHKNKELVTEVKRMVKIKEEIIEKYIRDREMK